MILNGKFLHLFICLFVFTCVELRSRLPVLVRFLFRYQICFVSLLSSIDDDDEGLTDDDDLPSLEEVEGAADEASKMEEVD